MTLYLIAAAVTQLSFGYALGSAHAAATADTTRSVNGAALRGIVAFLIGLTAACVVAAMGVYR